MNFGNILLSVPSSKLGILVDSLIEDEYWALWREVGVEARVEVKSLDMLYWALLLEESEKTHVLVIRDHSCNCGLLSEL